MSSERRTQVTLQAVARSLEACLGEPQQIDEATDLAALGLDSLDLVDLLAALEVEVGSPLNTEELSEPIRVRDLLELQPY